MQFANSGNSHVTLVWHILEHLSLHLIPLEFYSADGDKTKSVVHSMFVSRAECTSVCLSHVDSSIAFECNAFFSSPQQEWWQDPRVFISRSYGRTLSTCRVFSPACLEIIFKKTMCYEMTFLALISSALLVSKEIIFRCFELKFSFLNRTRLFALFAKTG